MSFSDMANLKTENIKDGFIRYNRVFIFKYIVFYLFLSF